MCTETHGAMSTPSLGNDSRQALLGGESSPYCFDTHHQTDKVTDSLSGWLN